MDLQIFAPPPPGVVRRDDGTYWRSNLYARRIFIDKVLNPVMDSDKDVPDPWTLSFLAKIAERRFGIPEDMAKIMYDQLTNKEWYDMLGGTIDEDVWWDRWAMPVPVLAFHTLEQEWWETKYIMENGHIPTDDEYWGHGCYRFSTDVRLEEQMVQNNGKTRDKVLRPTKFAGMQIG